MIIRTEIAADAAGIAALVTAAFRGHPYSDGTEAALVADLRKAGGFLLSLIAKEGDLLLGHQRGGIGRALMNAALARLRGQRGVVLTGDAGYYGRFGFAAQPGLNVPGVPEEHVLGLAFAPHPPPRGVIGFHPAFGV